MALRLPKANEKLTREASSGAGFRLPGAQMAGPGAGPGTNRAAHALLDQPVGALVKQFAPQYADKVPADKANQTFREVLKTSDFMTKAMILSVVGQHLPKGVTAEDLTRSVNEAPPPAEKPAAAAAPSEAPAAQAAPAAAQANQYQLPEAAAARGPTSAAARGSVAITPELMRAIQKIESGGNPNARTGSYKGLYQLSDGEFNRLGGKGSIFDPKENERIAGLKLQGEADQVARKLGRDLTPGEIYLVHQQGVGGAYEHLSNPDRPAWRSMHATGEGRNKGEGWSRLAIWGNVPDKDKARYGSVENLTSGEFTKMWSDRIARGGGGISGGSSSGSTTASREPPPLDPTPMVGAGESDYAAQAQVEAAKKMVDPTPNVGSGANDYPAPLDTSPSSDVSAMSSINGSSVGDLFSGIADTFAKGPVAQNAASKSTPANLPLPQLPTPTGAVPTVDPKMAEMHRQMLAAALQRLNSGKLV
jgi:hypothetical protein